MQPQLTHPGDLGHSGYAGRSPAANAIGRTDTIIAKFYDPDELATLLAERLK